MRCVCGHITELCVLPPSSKIVVEALCAWRMPRFQTHADLHQSQQLEPRGCWFHRHSALLRVDELQPCARVCGQGGVSCLCMYTQKCRSVACVICLLLLLLFRSFLLFQLAWPSVWGQKKGSVWTVMRDKSCRGRHWFALDRGRGKLKGHEATERAGFAENLDIDIRTARRFK